MQDLINNVERMTSIEIAEVTGKPHNDVLKAIRKMEPAWEKVHEGKFSLKQRTIQTSNGATRQVPYYSLTKTECLYIATKFNDEARAKLVLRWEHLEFGGINMDGDIDNDDLGLIKDYINGEAGDDFNKDIADTNGDSVNAITDVFFIQKFGGLKERGYLCR